jgi:hypothetical protein
MIDDEMIEDKMIEEVELKVKPVVKVKPTVELKKQILTFPLGDWNDLDTLTHRFKVRYGAKLVSKSDTGAMFEGKDTIIELKKV